jgi:hypothetical protein
MRLSMSSPENDPSTYFKRHPVRIASSRNCLAVELWNRELGISTLEKPDLEKAEEEEHVHNR